MTSNTTDDFDATAPVSPEQFDLARKAVAEFLGTALLLAIVVGSGIMGDVMAGGADGLALLANTLATGAGLMVLILIFGPISGAHFNPAVTLVFAVRGDLPWKSAGVFLLAQLAGGMAGVWAAHLMFDMPVLQVSLTDRTGPSLIFSEGIATFGLIATILGCVRFRPDATPFAVGLYITAAYWFTASTSFANPAVTLARAFSDTFAGIAPAAVPGFVLAQIFGALLAVTLFDWLLRVKNPCCASLYTRRQTRELHPAE
ncbi:MIP/aquaporin family protein [Parvularcula marina]|uniref:Aquaporin family protein n=1 Tax=Parvularcula marina TaxID=2292771 RepID=A0A371R8J3_9PROT|nr:aquaporin family protein [Parvularcula marina]